MPKLIQINTTLNIGSTGRIAEMIAQKAQSNGWDCYMAHGGRFIGKSKFETIQISSKLDNHIHAIEGEVFGRHGLGSEDSTKRFIGILNKLKPDIIHLHNIHGYYLNYRVLFEYLASVEIPVVWTLHDCWSFTGHCTHFENAGCEKWKKECNNCPQLMAQYKSRFVDRSKKNYLEKKKLYESLNNMTIVPVSHWLGDLVSQSILRKFPIRVIHNGIDLDTFKPAKSVIRERYNIPVEKTIVLGVVGSGFKGRKDFVEMSVHDDLQMVLVGLKDTEAKELPNNIIVIGKTQNQSELAEYYSSADVFANPTYNDTFPTTNLEALACGTPIVTYKTGGSPEAIDENTGIVVNKGDVKSMVDAIRKIASKGKERYSVICRERAVKCFNRNERFAEYLELYEELLDKHDGL